MASLKNIQPYTYRSFEIQTQYLKKKLTQIGINITKDEAARITFLSRRKYDNYDHFPLGESFFVRLLTWFTRNFKRNERDIALEVIKNIKYIDQYELKELTKSTFKNIINKIVIDVDITIDGDWYTYLEARNNMLYNELRRTIFVACADDIRFDLFRRYAMRTHPKPFIKDNFVEYYKINKTSLDDLPDFNRVMLIDQLSGSGTTMLRKECEKWTGKLSRFLNIWEEKIEDKTIYYCPYILSDVSNNNLISKIPIWKKDEGIKNDINILPTCNISISPCISNKEGTAIDEKKPVSKLCKKYYNKFIENEHIKKGGGAQYGYGGAGLTLIFQSNCPNNSLPLLWHAYNEWYPLFPRVGHHR